MGSEKRIGIVLLAAALVACSCASPVADHEPSPEQEQNGYVEIRRCEVEISVIIVLQVLCMDVIIEAYTLHWLHFRTTASALTTLLRISNSSREIDYKTLHCLQWSKSIASQVRV